MNDKILELLVNMNIDVLLSSGQALEGELIAVDPHGILVRSEAKTDDEIKEKYGVFVPHKNVELVTAKEDENNEAKAMVNYSVIFGG